MILGHVYVVDTALTRPPKEKIVLCVCEEPAFFLWFNTNPRPHGVGQLPVAQNAHRALSRDCHLDCSRVTTFPQHELDGAGARGMISAVMAGDILALLTDNPPVTLSETQIQMLLNNLAQLK